MNTYPKTQCKLCRSDSAYLFTTKVLQKYDVQYFQCNSCRFIQTENPYWLQESYGNAISNLDIGMLMRNLFYKEITADIINALFDKKKSFLDYGGGYGLFVRLMRDEGYNFFRQDNYCDNIFAQYFDIKDFKEPANFELLTCFEVFEHLPDPQTEIALMLQYSQSILFSTSLQPAIKFNASDDWFYFSPEIGQHIAFYTKKSLQIIAAKFGLNLYSDGKDLHLLTNKKWKFNWLKYISFKKRLKYQIQGKYFNSKHSLLYNDFEHVKNLIYNTK